MGLAVEEFWRLTPRETAAVFDAYAWRTEQERERRMAIAWWTAALSRSKKLPPLKKFVAPPETPLSDDEKAAKKAKAEQDFHELVERMGDHG